MCRVPEVSIAHWNQQCQDKQFKQVKTSGNGVFCCQKPLTHPCVDLICGCRSPRRLKAISMRERLTHKRMHNNVKLQPCSSPVSLFLFLPTTWLYSGAATCWKITRLSCQPSPAGWSSILLRLLFPALSRCHSRQFCKTSHREVLDVKKP